MAMPSPAVWTPGSAASPVWNASLDTGRRELNAPLPSCVGSEPGGTSGRAGELENVHARVRAIDDVDVAAVVDLDVVRLDRDFARFVRSRAHAPLVGLAGDGWNVERDLFGVERIADIHGAHAGVEMREEQYTLVVDRREVLVRGMRAEAPAAAAVVAVRLRHRERRGAERPGLDRRIQHAQHLAVLEAPVGRRLADDRNEVSPRLRLVRRHGRLMIVAGGGRGRSSTAAS